MMTRKVKVAALSATAALLAVFMLVYPALVTPAAAATTTSTSSSTPSKTYPTTGFPGGFGGPGQGPPGGVQAIMGGQHGPGFGHGQKVNVTVGQTFTLTSTSGNYVVSGSTTQNGTASGTLTFTVTGSLATGDTLSISGTIVIDGTTYTISSGSAVMSPSATAISVQGSTSLTDEFILNASAHGSFVSSTGQASLDLSNGTTEYLVFLSGAVTS